MPVHPKHKTNELLGLLLLMLSLLLVLALYSYSPFDSSLNVAADKSLHINYIGPTGAWIADLLLQIFGIPAFLFPIALLISGIQRLRGILQKEARPTQSEVSFLSVRGGGVQGVGANQRGAGLCPQGHMGEVPCPAAHPKQQQKIFSILI